MKRKGVRLGNKKGISVMIGYILLVVFALIISVTIYQWLKSFVPASSLECPDGVSVFLENASYDSGADKLTITIVNNGRFNVGGYFASISTSADQDLPNVDISPYLNEEESSAINLSSSVLFIQGSEDNPFIPGERETHVFYIPAATGTPYLVRVVPTRQEKIEGKVTFIGCGDARVDQVVTVS